MTNPLLDKLLKVKCPHRYYKSGCEKCVENDKIKSQLESQLEIVERLKEELRILMEREINIGWGYNKEKSIIKTLQSILEGEKYEP